MLACSVVCMRCVSVIAFIATSYYITGQSCVGVVYFDNFYIMSYIILRRIIILLYVSVNLFYVNLLF